MGENSQISSSIGESEGCVMLSKDRKPICRARVDNASVHVSYNWRLDKTVNIRKLPFLAGLQRFTLSQAAENSRDEKEWHKFLNFLRKYDKVGVVKSECFELYIIPPDTRDSNSALAAYRELKSHNSKSTLIPSQPNVEVKEQDPVTNGGICINERRPESCGPKQSGILARNYARADPSYLKTLGQTHSWLIGAIAELVDNSRDAKATKLEISIEMIYSKISGKRIPMLSIVDDGHGMTHEDVVRMTSLDHKAPDEDDTDRIGRFGVGFKTGAMRLGKDALVLTQTAVSRSIAFLSQSLNDGKDNLEIPIVSFYRQGHVMEVDTTVQSEDLAKYNLKAIKEFSPFNKYLIGEKAALFHENTGTQIYIWNLDEWGSDYSLMWQEKSSFSLGDICVRSKKIRSRSGQISKKVPLDYSLRAYLEVIFLVPRIQIYVQGSRVKTRPLEKSLHKTVVETGVIMGRHVQLTLGRCQLEWDKANCGIFIYWRGRLIEAYKRVGGMIHSGSVGRGVIGVIDVTDLMNDGKGSVWVLNNKQGFQDCVPYEKLEKWLGHKSDIYWDNNFDRLQPTTTNLLYKPDHEWVQCNKCRKWRMLSSDFNIDDLPDEWFCYMEPYTGCCEIPEEKVKGGLITLSTKRTRYEHSELSDREEKVSDPSTENATSSHSIPLIGLRKSRTRAFKKKPR